jgi:pimeloyl-ACP methyl ester carboxylesterase
LLVIVAALLTPSGAVNGVAEAFGLHEIGQQVVSTAVTDRTDSFFLARGPLLSGIRAGDTGSIIAGANGAAGDGTGSALPWAIPASLTQPDASVVGTPGGVGAGVGDGVATANGGTAATRVDLALLPKLRGTALLNQLALLPRAELSEFVSQNKSLMHGLVKNPPAAREVSAWWAATSPSARASLVKVSPEVLGNLPGVPFEVRNDANRTYLKSSIHELKSSMRGLGRGEIVNARVKLHMLEQVQKALRSPTPEAAPGSVAPDKSLLTFESEGSGRAAIVIGDLATADYVSYLVPGMFFSVDTALNTWTNVATDLNREQTAWVSRLSAHDPSMAGKTVATVAWIGYQTPGITGIASLTLADQGADLIGRAIDGVQAVRSGSEPFVTVIGHSYGSTAAMIELAKDAMHVDALALIGSPGSAAQTASALSVTNNNVYVGEAAWDPVVNSAFYGSDPGSSTFGAHRMSVAGGVDPITHNALTASAGHLGYFAPGSESMRNLALIGLNHGSLVTQGTTMDASRTLR